MRNFVFVTAVLFLFQTMSFAQPESIHDVTKWQFSIEYGSNNEATIIMTCQQFDGWHIYSQKEVEGAINVPTSFVFEKSSNYELVGSTEEPESELETTDGVPSRYFHSKKVTFKQKIKILTKEKFDLKLAYTYMACKESCFPPEFDIPQSIAVEPQH